MFYTKKFNTPLICAVSVIMSLFFYCCRKSPDFKPVSNAETSSKFTTRTGPPNIILVIGDDVGVEVPTYSGGSSYSTPNLDFMAANGMQFSQFYCHPDGFPSRLALL